MGVSGMQIECDTGNEVLMNSGVNYRHVSCALSNKMYAFGVSFDFAKAIHCVHHELLQ